MTLYNPPPFDADDPSMNGTPRPFLALPWTSPLTPVVQNKLDLNSRSPRPFFGLGGFFFLFGFCCVLFGGVVFFFFFFFSFFFLFFLFFLWLFVFGSFFLVVCVLGGGFVVFGVVRLFFPPCGCFCQSERKGFHGSFFPPVSGCTGVLFSSSARECSPPPPPPSRPIFE